MSAEGRHPPASFAFGLGGNESHPGVLQPFGGFADGIPVENGYVRLPEAPGVGFQEKVELIELTRSVAE